MKSSDVRKASFVKESGDIPDNNGKSVLRTHSDNLVALSGSMIRLIAHMVNILPGCNIGMITISKDKTVNYFWYS